MRNVRLSILIALLCASVGFGLRAQEPTVALTVAVGFDGACHAEAWCPLRVTATNDGPDTLGELHLRYRIASGGEASIYSQVVTLPAHSRKAYVFYLPPGTRVTPDEPILQLVEEARTVASIHVPLQRVRSDDRLYVIVGAPAGALAFLGDVEPAGRGEARVASVTLDALPDEPLAWESIDVLILQDVDTSALTDVQRQAMRTWLQHGGELVLGGGPRAAATLSGLTNIAPVTVQGTSSVQRLTGLQAYVDVPVAEGPFAVAVSAVNAAGTLMISQQIADETLVLAARRDIGRGAVTFLAFDPGLNPFTGQTARVDFWRRLLGDVSQGTRAPEFRAGYALDQALSVIPGVQAPPTWQLLGFLSAYTLLVGPVNYLVLHKMDRRTWAWLTVPLLAVAFSLLAYLTGFQLRGVDPILHRLMVAHVPAGADQGRATQAVALFSPRRRTYTLQSEQPYVTNVRVADVPFVRDALAVRQTTDGAQIDAFRVDVGELRPFALDGYVPVPDLVSDLTVEMEPSGGVLVSGTIQAGDSALEGLVLLGGTDMQDLGDLSAGEEKRIQARFSDLSPDFGTFPLADQVFQHSDRWGDPMVRRRYNLLLAVHPSRELRQWNGPDFGSNLYLLAWQESGLPSGVTLVDHDAAEHATALYIYALPSFTPGPTSSSEIVVPPELFDWDYETVTGEAHPVEDGFLLYPESALRLTFMPIPRVRFDDPETLTVRMTPEGNVDPQPPHLAIWNDQTTAWESLNFGWGEYVIEAPEAYVSEVGVVRFRVESTHQEGPAVVPLPSLTLAGR